VTVTVFGPRLRWLSPIPRPVDISWDVGDSRRYTVDGREDKPTVADVALLVDLGAESIWGVDGDLELSPHHLYAAFHRDLNAYRHDGVDEAFPFVPIDEDLVRLAAGARPFYRLVETPAGPIVYHEALGAGRLSDFYIALGGAMSADAEEL
jgi:hypothetical protein